MGKVRAQVFLFPDSVNAGCHVWSCETDNKFFVIPVHDAIKSYPDYDLDHAIRTYAIKLFMELHGVDYKPLKCVDK